MVPSRLIRETNTIAIRLRGSFRDVIGVTDGPMSLGSMQVLEREFWSGQLTNLIFASIYFSSAIFYIIVYFRIRELREYLWFGSLGVMFGLQQLMVNEFRFVFGDSFLFYKLIEQFCYLLIPALAFYFFAVFYRLRFHRLLHLYPAANVVMALVFLILMDPVVWSAIMKVWFYIHLPFFGYYAYVAVWRKAIGQGRRDSVLVSCGIVSVVSATIHYFAVQNGFVEGPDYFDFGVLLFHSFLSLALIYRLINLQQEVQIRQDQLNSINSLRIRVFRYLNTFIKNPVEAIVSGSAVLLDKSSPEESRAEALGALKGEVESLQSLVDDILELSRLEVVRKAEEIAPVNFSDFITAVIHEEVITCYIKVNPDIVLRASIELVNSFVIRLIDFPPFREFKHIDLIITSDLAENIHFRFLLYHTDSKKTRQLHELLGSKEPDKGNLWIKWAIISQIIRILDGELHEDILNRKFLRIDIRLAGELPKEVAKAKGSGEEIAVTSTHALEGAVAEASVGEDERKMTVGDLVSTIRSKLGGRK